MIGGYFFSLKNDRGVYFTAGKMSEFDSKDDIDQPWPDWYKDWFQNQLRLDSMKYGGFIVGHAVNTTWFEKLCMKLKPVLKPSKRRERKMRNKAFQDETMGYLKKLSEQQKKIAKALKNIADTQQEQQEQQENENHTDRDAESLDYKPIVFQDPQRYDQARENIGAKPEFVDIPNANKLDGLGCVILDGDGMVHNRIDVTRFSHVSSFIGTPEKDLVAFRRVFTNIKFTDESSKNYGKKHLFRGYLPPFTYQGISIIDYDIETAFYPRKSFQEFIPVEKWLFVTQEYLEQLSDEGIKDSCLEWDLKPIKDNEI